MEMIACFQLGAAFHARRQLDAARRHYGEAAAICEQGGNLARAAEVWRLLAQICEDAGLVAAAEDWHRKAIAVGRDAGSPTELVRQLFALARLLHVRQERAGEARALVDEALVAVQRLPPAAPERWHLYELLGGMAAQEAANIPERESRLALEVRAESLRELAKRAPQLFATLAALDAAPSVGRAVILGRISQCWQIAEQPAFAMACLNEALGIAEALLPDALLAGLKGALSAQLAELLCGCGAFEDAARACRSALVVAESSADLRGQARCLEQLAMFGAVTGNVAELLTCCLAARPVLQRLHDPDTEAATLGRLGGLLHQHRQWEQARRFYLGAAQIGDLHGDTEDVCYAREQLAMLGGSAGVEDAGHNAAAAEAASAGVIRRDVTGVDIDVTVVEEVVIDFVFATDLLVDGWRECKSGHWSRNAELPAGPVRPVWRPCLRNWSDEHGVTWLAIALEEPDFTRYTGCTVMQKRSRKIGIAGAPDVLARLMRALDGERTVAEILQRFPQRDRQAAAYLLAALCELGALDITGRAMAQWIHAATKKGVLPGGGLAGADILRLAMDGNHRAYPAAQRCAVADAVPDCLQPLHALTRVRRSRRHFLGLPVSRSAFDALLETACGVSGAMNWDGRTSKLRAYPSSGGLYAIEIYPVVLRVEGLAPAVYHFRPDQRALDLVGELDRERFLEAMLPVEREMVAGTGAMICLAGYFQRHESKYGEGGYRMLVAEAGHISQNIVLAATALGLSARPFGGVFDELVNQDLGLDVTQEQFLLSVLLGHADRQT